MTWRALFTGSYWKGLRSEVAKLAGAVRARRSSTLHMAAAGLVLLVLLGGRDLHSSTFRLNVSTFCWIRGVHELPPVY